jgi:hypothetical protein
MRRSLAWPEARGHGLVLYDPQGPSLLNPDIPAAEYAPDAREVVRVSALLLGAVVVAVGAWCASITALSWLAVLVAGFLAVMAAHTLVVYARLTIERRRA